jgi:hypothetical protein
MPSTHSVVLPLVAGVAAVALTLRRYVATLLFELQVDVTPRIVTSYALGARFAAFVVVYALLLGVAYWAGARREDASGDAVLVGATFAVAAVSALVATVVVLAVVGAGTRGPVFAAVTAVGSSAAVGVQLAVVAFAGVAAGRR